MYHTALSSDTSWLVSTLAGVKPWKDTRQSVTFAMPAVSVPPLAPWNTRVTHASDPIMVPRGDGPNPKKAGMLPVKRNVSVRLVAGVRSGGGTHQSDR